MQQLQNKTQPRKLRNAVCSMVKTFIKYWSHMEEEDTHHLFSSFLMEGGQEKTHLRGEGSRLRMKWIPRKAEKGYESRTLVTGGGNDQASPPASIALVLPSYTQPKRFLGLSRCGEDIISPDSWASISTNLGGALELHDHRQDREQRTLSCSNTQSHHVYHPGPCQN